MTNKRGFTLIELIIVIVIIVILGGLAYPSYLSYIIQSRRADARIELIKAQLQQTHLHILSPHFSLSNSDIGLPTNNKYYTFSVVSAGDATYLMKAVAKKGTTQEKDVLACRTLFIDQNNYHTFDGARSNEQCW